MNIEEIRNSGLLESYIIGTLTENERAEVEKYVEQYPELKSELSQIERALRTYGEIKGVQPRKELKGEIIKSITGKSVDPDVDPPKKGFGPFFFPSIILACLLGASLLWGSNHANEAEELAAENNDLRSENTSYQLSCDSIADANAELEAILAIINNAGNRIVPMTATGNYASTTLYLHTNEALRKNYLQALVLPDISREQAFQLWSLKPNQDPIPLSVFSDSENQIFEVDFEDGTATYAITIEPAGGSQVPNLELLIGTMGV
ncbi:anti-sigma factor [Portibacter lacus]|uniref:Anti-sigma K factor RskA C-terminal domain-containing protein n=1 Tax=Portibacter lacus TaxID=1099794 RepID=A0AA37SLB1_9BACT|nr:anti-sigma factor [Portibacter lacus]GLR15739.1 hypothetical protein GCM10007940_03540 [Portibacter lacus]